MGAAALSLTQRKLTLQKIQAWLGMVVGHVPWLLAQLYLP